MKPDLRHYAQLAAVAAVVVGCWQVLVPFIPAILFAAVVCSATWPLYVRLRSVFAGRNAAAAFVMTLLLVVIVIGPSSALAVSLADDITTASLEQLRVWLAFGPPQPPEWLRGIPLVGDAAQGYWLKLAGSRDEVLNLLKSLGEPARNVVVAASKAVGTSVMQLALATFIAYFFYRDGEAMVGAVRRVLEELAGHLGDDILTTVDNTLKGVVDGIFGTAFAQALVAIVGFLVAGVPGPFLLGFATFLLSMIPGGPVLVWGGATIWLFNSGQTGWAIFMLAYGLLVISSIDNFVKPYLISRTSSLPILLIVLGVFGGVIAFGFIGIFIGPPILAVGTTLIQLWTSKSRLQLITPAADDSRIPR